MSLEESPARSKDPTLVNKFSGGFMINILILLLHSYLFRCIRLEDVVFVQQKAISSGY